MINFDKEVDKCVEILKNGGIILYPTDTIYGIGCDSYNFKAMENVNKLKGSNPSKPLIHLMNSLKYGLNQKVTTLITECLNLN